VKKCIDLSDRKGLAAALVPKIRTTTAVPVKNEALPVDDSLTPENFFTDQIPLNGPGPAIIATSRASRSSIKITNLTANDVYIGYSKGLTVANGELLPGGRGQWISLPTQSQIWGIPATGTQGSVSYSEIF
jgi:hypothetical protein